MTQPSTPQPYYVEDEIELREILLFLWQARWWMLVGLVLALLLASGYVFLSPPRYTAEAWIRWREQEDGSLPTLVNGSLTDIVTSDSWWFTYIGERPEGLEFKASVPKQQPRLHLVVTATTPDQAYTWARRWADAVLAWLQEQDAQFLAGLQQAVDAAREEYRQAHQAYLDFLEQDPRPGLQAQIQELEHLQTCILLRKNYFLFVLADIQEVRWRWHGRATLSPQDALLYLTLQQRVFSAAPCGGSNNLIIQPNNMVFGGATAEEGLLRLERLEAHIQALLQEEEQRLPALEQELARLRELLEAAGLEAMELGTARDTSWERWQRLKEQVDTVKTAMALNPIGVLEVPPIQPERPEARWTLLTLTVAGLSGSFLGLMAFGVQRVLAMPEESSS